MASQTTNWQIPYSEGADSVATIDETMQAMAERLDALTSRHAAGTASKTLATGATETVVVNFPAGRFTAAPIVTVTLTGPIPANATQYRNVWCSASTTTTATISFRAESGVAMTCDWHAVQA